MTILSSKHYGVTISMQIDGFPGCCGARILHSFRAEGRTNDLTKEQKEKMYTEIIRQATHSCPGLLIVSDCVLNFGEWADLGRHGGGWKAGTEERGDLSLENFCEFCGFARGPVAQNSNSGNLVACFSLNVRSVTEDNSDNVVQLTWKTPDFSDEKKDGRSTDVDSILAELEAAVAAAR